MTLRALAILVSSMKWPATLDWKEQTTRLGASYSSEQALLDDEVASTTMVHLGKRSQNNSASRAARLIVVWSMIEKKWSGYTTSRSRSW